MREQITRITTKIRSGFEEAGVSLLIGGIDISANIDARDATTDGKTKSSARRTRYQLHLWAIGREADLRRAEARLREIFKSTRSIRRPVMIQPFDGDAAGYAYALKTGFNCRVGYRERIELPPQMGTGLRSTNGSRPTISQRLNTRAKPLTTAQDAEIAIILNILGFDRRIVAIGADLLGTRDVGRGTRR